MKIFLAIKPEKKAEEIAQKVSDLLTKSRHTEVALPQKSDLILCVGGDGSLLHNINRYLHLNIPFVGLNAGSLGYLSQLKAENLPEGLDIIESSGAKAFRTIEVAIGNVGGYRAIQDFRIERPDHFPLRIKIEQNEKTISRRHIGDGIIVSGTIGSTAYNLSAGGPILDLDDPDLIVTPICPVPHKNDTFDPITSYFRHSTGQLVFVAETEARVVLDNQVRMVSAKTPVSVTLSLESFRLYVERRNKCEN